MQHMNRTPSVNDVFQFYPCEAAYNRTANIDIYGGPTSTSVYHSPPTTHYVDGTATSDYRMAPSTVEHSVPTPTNEYTVPSLTNGYGMHSATNEYTGPTPTNEYRLPSITSLQTSANEYTMSSTTDDNSRISSTNDYIPRETPGLHTQHSATTEHRMPTATNGYGLPTTNGVCNITTNADTYEQANVETSQRHRIFTTEANDFFGLSTSFLIGKHLPSDTESSLQTLTDCCNALYKEATEFQRFDDNPCTPTNSSFGSVTTAAVDSSLLSGSDPNHDFSSAVSPNSTTYSTDNVPADDTSESTSTVSSPDSSVTSSASESSLTSVTSVASRSSSKTKSDTADSKKNTRTKYTVEQTNKLERLFQENQYPNQYTVERVATDIGVSEGRIRIWFQNKRARWRRLASAGKLDPSPPTNIPSDSFSKKQEMANPLAYSDVPQHQLSQSLNYPSQSVNYATPYTYNCDYQAPQANNPHIQQAIANLMYSSADAGSQLPSPFHAVTSLYQQIANSPYSYSTIR